MGGTWRVQAFLLPGLTGADVEIPYMPIYCRNRRRAKRARQRLVDSFAPGMVRIEMVRTAEDHRGESRERLGAPERIPGDASALESM